MQGKNLDLGAQSSQAGKYMALCSMAGGLLIAAPDPDLFDGRRSGSQSAHSGSGVSSSESGGEERNQSNTDENGENQASTDKSSSAALARVRSSVEGSTEAVSPSNPNDEPGGAASHGSGENGGGKSHSGGGATSQSSDGSRGSEARDLSSIGTIGSGSIERKVEVNRSKAAGTTDKLSRTSPIFGGGAANPNDGRNATRGRDSQPPTDGSSGDFGETLPSGL